MDNNLRFWCSRQPLIGVLTISLMLGAFISYAIGFTKLVPLLTVTGLFFAVGTAAAIEVRDNKLARAGLTRAEVLGEPAEEVPSLEEGAGTESES